MLFLKSVLAISFLPSKDGIPKHCCREVSVLVRYAANLGGLGRKVRLPRKTTAEILEWLGRHESRGESPRLPRRDIKTRIERRIDRKSRDPFDGSGAGAGAKASATFRAARRVELPHARMGEGHR